MQKNSRSESGLFHPRIFLAFVFCLSAVLLVVFSLAGPSSKLPLALSADTEIAVDLNGRLYFNALTLANFSTARSDDHGISFTCSNTGVPDTAVDRQWYAIDGDPLNGGSLYLVNDEIGPGGVMCGSSVGNNVLVMYRSPVTGLEPTAGVAFGPANKITAVGSCDEAIMGNDEISPIPTTLGQPNGAGGFVTLPAPVKHIFVIHDNAALRSEERRVGKECR